MTATRKFFSGLVEARLVDEETWAVTCKGIELGVIEHHRGDPDWIATNRWEILGSRVKFGFAGRHLMHRYSHGFNTLEGAVTELCQWKSAIITTLLPEGDDQ